VSLCSPDPQAFRPPEEAANVLHVGLPTNFKATTFADETHNLLLRKLEADIDFRLFRQHRPLAEVCSAYVTNGKGTANEGLAMADHHHSPAPLTNHLPCRDDTRRDHDRAA